MISYIVRRLIVTIPTMLIVTMAIFGILRITPGGPALAMLGDQADPETIRALEHELGLDQPLHIQYVNWLAGVLRGDFGRSAFGNQPVTELILQRVMPTAQLAIMAMLISIAIGITAGCIAAVRHNTAFDAGASVLAILGVSTPSFFLAVLLVWIFSIQLKWLPSLGYTSPFDDLGMNLRQMIMPSVTLGCVMAAVVTRQTRGAMLDVLYHDYMRTARAKGLQERIVLFRHGLANALIPVVTIVGLQLGAVLGGSIIIESVFGLPGNGQLLITAIFTRDFPVVQGVVLVIAMVFILVNLAVDLLYAVLDPRIRLS